MLYFLPNLREAMEAAVKALKTGKYTGVDNITFRLTSGRSKLSDNVGFLRIRRWLAQQRLKISNVYSALIAE